MRKSRKSDEVGFQEILEAKDNAMKRIEQFGKELKHIKLIDTADKKR